MATKNTYHIFNAVNQTHYNEDGFMMGTTKVLIGIDGYEFADGYVYFTVSLWDVDADTAIYGGTKKYASSQDAIEFVTNKFKLTY